MKAIKLTPKQRELFENLKHTGGSLRKHIRPSNSVCYRLMDKQFNPVKNYTMVIVEKLIEKDLLELRGFDYVLKATCSEMVSAAH